MEFQYIQHLEYMFRYANNMSVWFVPLWVSMFGAIFGSFITCMVYRVPRKMNISHPPSHCPACKNKLKIIDLIPIFSWLIFKGKCRQCKSTIPFRYIAIEILIVLWALASLFLTPTLISLLLLFFAGTGFIFTVLCWFMEKTLTLKVLLFSCILSGIFLFVTL